MATRTSASDSSPATAAPCSGRRSSATRGRASSSYTGELIEATRAAQIGLINRAVPADELDEVVDSFVSRIANGPKVAIQGTKASINQPLRAVAGTNLDLSLTLEGISNSSADHQEGINAFRERREPRFTGR